jgi:DNA primase
VLGFSGRILGDGEPKYLNTPDTLVFSKSRNLFALNLAKKSKLGMIILAEGNIDVMSLHQAGFDCAVASLGTALTSEQARLMTRYTQEVVICYDSDGAGVKAAQRAIGILESVGLKVRVLQIPGAKDPDEFIQKNGADAFKLILDKSESRVDYQLLQLKGKYDLQTDDGRVGFLSEATSLIAGLQNAAEREIYGAKAAEYAGVTKDGFMLDVRKSARRKQYRDRKQDEKKELFSKQQRSNDPIRYDRSDSQLAEEGVLGILTAYPDMEPMTAELTPEDFSSEFSSKAFKLIRDRIRQGKSVEIPMLQEQLTADEISRLTQIASRPGSRANSEKAMADYIEKIKQSKIKSQGADVLQSYYDAIKQKKGMGDNYGK